MAEELNQALVSLDSTDGEGDEFGRRGALCGLI